MTRQHLWTVDVARLLGPALGLGLASFGACGHGAGDAPLGNRNPAAAATGVCAIDWRNRDYALDGLGTVTFISV